MTRTAARLRRLVRSHRRARALAVVLAGAGAGLAVAGLGVALAPRPAAVIGAWLAMLAVAAGAVWATWRAGRAQTPGEVARLVEGATAARAGSVSSLVTRPGTGASAALFAVADARGEHAVDGAAPVVRGMLRRGTRRRLGTGLAAVIAGAVVFVAVSPGPSGAAAFWHPLRALRDARAPVRLAVDRTSVPRGESVRVSVHVPGAAGRGGAGAVLWTRAPGEAWRPSPLILDSAGRAVRALGPLTADLHLRAASGRRRSPEITVTVVVPPFIADLALTARFPPYLARSDEPLVPGPDTIALPAGTAIHARGLASASLAWAVWAGPGRRVALAVRDGTFEGRFVPAADGTWRLDAAARVGGALDGPRPALTIRLVPDSAPVVRVPVPGRDTTLPLSLRQPLVIDARDDHGLTRLTVVSWRVSRTGRVDAPQRETLDVTGAGERVLLQRELDARERGLLPGDTLRLVVEVADNAPRPRVGRSEELVLRLPSMEELRAGTRAAAREVAAAAESVATAQSALSDRTRDLGQGRSREDGPAGAGRRPAEGPGALPFEARERAEEVARDQAALQQRIAELSEAVDDIAQAARAAGLGDTAFEARLAEVRELLRRAVTPEIEARLRELQAALARLDPEAVREALRRLAEAQEELRRELDRSQELFQRAAVEGALSSLAADAEALRRRQEQWNRDAAPRADTAAAAAERDMARLADSLSAGIGQAARDLAPRDAAAAEGGRLEAPRAAAERAGAAMRRAAGAAESGDAAGAEAHGEAAADALEDLPEELLRRRDSLAVAWRRETLEALHRALSETAGLAERQEDVVEALRNGETGGAARAAQAALEEGTQAIERQIREAAGRHALVSPALERALGYAQHQMRAARRQLEQGDPNGSAAAALAQEALDALNATAYALARTRDDVASARSGSGFQEAVEQLARLAGQQRGVNADAQGLMPMMGPGSQALMQQLRALAARQRALAEQLERLQAGGVSGAAGALAQEARELARQLDQGRLDRRTIERQERLYRRLLDAGRTLRGQEPDEAKERVSRSADTGGLHRPPPLAPPAGGAGPRVRYPTWDELQGLTPDERRLVLEYFRRLNEPR